MNIPLNIYEIVAIVIVIGYFFSLLNQIVHWLTVIHATLTHQVRLVEKGKSTAPFSGDDDES